MIPSFALERQEVPIVLLAGGLGTRLRPAVPNLPKILAPIRERPFIDYLLQDIHAQGFKHVILSLGYSASTVIEYINTSEWPNHLKLEFVVEPHPLGTGGGLKHVGLKLGLQSWFIVANGDTLVTRGLSDIFNDNSKKNRVQKIGLSTVTDSGRFGTVEINESGLIESFKEKSKNSTQGVIYSGLAFLRFEPLLRRKGTIFSLENDYFQELINQKELHGVVLSGNFIDIGVPEDYLRFIKEFS